MLMRLWNMLLGSRARAPGVETPEAHLDADEHRALVLEFGEHCERLFQLEEAFTVFTELEYQGPVFVSIEVGFGRFHAWRARARPKQHVPQTHQHVVTLRKWIPVFGQLSDLRMEQLRVLPSIFGVGKGVRIVSS